MGICSKCGAPIREGAGKCWNCGESEPLTVTDPDGQVRNEPYVPRKVKNHRGCVLIVVVALIILVILECIPLFEVRYLGEFPTLSTALKMTKEPYYSMAQSFVDFMMVMLILDVVALVGGLFKAKKLSLIASVIAIINLFELLMDAARETNDPTAGLVQFTIGFFILMVAHIVIIISALVE